MQIISFVILKEVKSPSVDEEFRSTGSVPFSIYWKYFIAGGGRLSFFFFILNCVFCQFLFSGSDYWLSLWTDAEQRRADSITNSNSTSFTNDSSASATFNQTIDGESYNFIKNFDSQTGINVFTILTASVFTFSLVRSIQFFIICMKSSINLHNSMFESVIRVPLLFFDHNPVGNLSIFLHF